MYNTRRHCAKLTRLCAVALTVLVIAGCQSNGERDLIARDRRMREDQMWAMQDYIQQYQQLVCQFRSENASLRRQLNEMQNGTSVDRGIQPSPRAPIAPPATHQVPPPQQNTTPRVDQPPTSAPDVDSPDIPPLGQNKLRNLSNNSQLIAEAANHDHYAQLASYDSSAAQTEGATSSNILLSGKVVANDNGGPRLVVDIEPFDSSGHAARFEGEVSLALLSSQDGVQYRLARWDFGPNEVAAAVNSSAGKPTMRFTVQLPADTKVDGPTELWAKLAANEGSRQFSHAKVNLGKPGAFSSRTDRVWASEEPAVAASHVETSAESTIQEELSASADALETPVSFNESDWSTAQPGKPGVLPAEPEDTGRGWRASSEPVPMIAAKEKSSPSPSYRHELPKQIHAAPSKPAPAKMAQKPSWTPERPGATSQAVRPIWSATR